MSRGEHHYQEEVSKAGKLDQFAKEQPKRDLPWGTLRKIEKQAGTRLL